MKIANKLITASVILITGCTSFFGGCDDDKDKPKPDYGQISYPATGEVIKFTEAHKFRASGAQEYDNASGTAPDYVDVLLKKDPKLGRINLGDSARVIVHRADGEHYYQKQGEYITYGPTADYSGHQFTFSTLTQTYPAGGTGAAVSGTLVEGAE